MFVTSIVVLRAGVMYSSRTPGTGTARVPGHTCSMPGANGGLEIIGRFSSRSAGCFARGCVVVRAPADDRYMLMLLVPGIGQPRSSRKRIARPRLSDGDRSRALGILPAKHAIDPREDVVDGGGVP
jgi:hypothetical protein